MKLITARRALALAFPIYSTWLALACVNKVGDVSPDAGAPSPLGSGSRVAEVVDPSLPNHPANDASVTITGAVTLIVDTYDETMNGKSLGDVYVQDVGSQAPWSGLQVYKPTYVPADLHVAPGDVLDLTGTYQEETGIGSTVVFPAGQVQAELSEPVCTFRYEYTVPAPVVIKASDLSAFETGRPWMSMLVTVNDVTIPVAFTNSSGRVTTYLTSDTSNNAPQISNELTAIDPTKYPAGTHFTSVTGIVTYFGGSAPSDYFNFHIAPRSSADLVVGS